MGAPEVLEPGDDGLSRAIELLRAGEVVAFPTDTVYGLAALASMPRAVERIFEIKGRPRDRALVLMPPAPGELVKWVEIDRRARGYMAAYWPGPLTLVLKACPGVGPPLAAEAGTLAVRVPEHVLALSLLEAVGEALATTSANRSGEPPALLPSQIAQLEGVAAVVDGGLAPGGRASTVLDLTGAQPVVLREGPITAHELLEV